MAESQGRLRAGQLVRTKIYPPTSKLSPGEGVRVAVNVIGRLAPAAAGGPWQVAVALTGPVEGTAYRAGDVLVRLPGELAGPGGTYSEGSTARLAEVSVRGMKIRRAKRNEDS